MSFCPKDVEISPAQLSILEGIIGEADGQDTTNCHECHGTFGDRDIIPHVCGEVISIGKLEIPDAGEQTIFQSVIRHGNVATATSH